MLFNRISSWLDGRQTAKRFFPKECCLNLAVSTWEFQLETLNSQAMFEIILNTLCKLIKYLYTKMIAATPGRLQSATA